MRYCDETSHGISKFNPGNSCSDMEYKNPKMLSKQDPDDEILSNKGDNLKYYKLINYRIRIPETDSK